MAYIIERVERLSTNTKRVKVHFTEGKPLLLALETALEAGLRPGLVLSEDDLIHLLALDTQERCHAAALSYLSYRPRSERELRTYLGRKAYPAEAIEKTIAHLKETHLVDDEAFARFWVENRAAFRPRSGRALRSELHQKGVANEAMAEALPSDDADAAYQAANSRRRSLAGLDQTTFRRRLLPFLQRRGFGYGVANAAAARLWSEMQEASADETAQ